MKKSSKKVRRNRRNKKRITRNKRRLMRLKGGGIASPGFNYMSESDCQHLKDDRGKDIECDNLCTICYVRPNIEQLFFKCRIHHFCEICVVNISTSGRTIECPYCRAHPEDNFGQLIIPLITEIQQQGGTFIAPEPINTTHNLVRSFERGIDYLRNNLYIVYGFEVFLMARFIYTEDDLDLLNLLLGGVLIAIFEFGNNFIIGRNQRGGGPDESNTLRINLTKDEIMSVKDYNELVSLIKQKGEVENPGIKITNEQINNSIVITDTGLPYTKDNITMVQKRLDSIKK